MKILTVEDLEKIVEDRLNGLLRYYGLHVSLQMNLWSLLYD